MKLGKIEKWFINTKTHSKKVIEKAERLLDFIRIDPQYRLLEIGCGNGSVSKYIHDKYKVSVTGTDIDNDQIKIARKGIKDKEGMRFFFADATCLPFKDESFDIIFSINVLHHISGWLSALKEIDRVLARDRYFLLAELLFKKKSIRFSRLLAGHSYGIVNLKELENFLKDNGYSVIGSRLSSSLIWDNLEAAYRKGQS